MLGFAQLFASRLVKAAVILIAIVVMNFFLVHAAPGDPAMVMAGEAGAAEARPGDEVVIMSNGGFGGIHQKLLDALGR